MKKVIFLTVHLNYGGAEVGLLTTLKYIDRSLLDCTVVCIEKKGPIGEEIEKLGFRVIYLNDGARLFNLGLIGKIRRILNTEKPDILHTSLFYANFFGRAAALFSRPKGIITEERSMYTEKRFYHILIDRIFAPMTDRIIVCSKSVLEFTAHQEGIAKDKFHLIYNAVDTGRFSIARSKEEIRKERGLPTKGFVIGSIGSLIPKKGHKFLIEAAAVLAKKIPDLKVIIIGDGPERDALWAKIRELSLEGVVSLPGARKDIPEMLRAMDVFVLPSFQEGFPRTLIEAMYMGLSTVASAISGIPEIVNDGENGILISAGDHAIIADKCLMLYNDPGLRVKIGANARKTIESGYMPEDYARKLERLYSDVLQGAAA